MTILSTERIFYIPTDSLQESDSADLNDFREH